MRAHFRNSGKHYILLIEGPHVANASNLRESIDNQLQLNYEVDVNSLQNTFTVVADGEAPKAKMAKRSVTNDTETQEIPKLDRDSHINESTNIIYDPSLRCHRRGEALHSVEDFRLSVNHLLQNVRNETRRIRQKRWRKGRATTTIRFVVHSIFS